MRDADGNGNVYYDDLFANGIPLSSLIFWSLNGTIGFINTIVTPIFFYTSCIKQSYHQNLRLVTSNLYLTFFLTSLANTIHSVLILTRTSDRQYDQIFLILHILQVTGPDLWKTNLLAIILERSAATIYYKSYETHTFIPLGVILYLFGISGCILTISTFIFRYYFLIGIEISLLVGFICSLFIFLLFWVNKKLRMIKFNNKTYLSHRYQITENLRFLQIIIPVIILGSIIGPIAMIIAATTALIDYKLVLYYPIFPLVTNLYVPIVFLIYYIKDKKTKRMLLKFLHCKLTEVEPETNQIRNVVGDLLVINNSSVEHFKQLDKLWA